MNEKPTIEFNIGPDGEFKLPRKKTLHSVQLGYEYPSVSITFKTTILTKDGSEKHPKFADEHSNVHVQAGAPTDELPEHLRTFLAAIEEPLKVFLAEQEAIENK